MRPVTPEQIAAYEKAEYVVFAMPELVLRIGEPNPGLDELLEADGVSTAAYITAANPRGEPASRSDNDIATTELHESLAAAGHICYGGEGRDPQGLWTPEPSFLVLGISRARAEAVAREFEQNAIVFVQKGRPPELVVLKD
jgi:Protein of unknown function (DUF3293)